MRTITQEPPRVHNAGPNFRPRAGDLASLASLATSRTPAGAK